MIQVGLCAGFLAALDGVAVARGCSGSAPAGMARAFGMTKACVRRADDRA